MLIRVWAGQSTECKSGARELVSAYLGSRPASERIARPVLLNFEIEDYHVLYGIVCVEIIWVEAAILSKR